MYEVCLAKFSQHQDHADALLDTGKKVLAEASPYDRIWGIGMSSAYAIREKEDHTKWNGQNLLGIALMKVRSALLIAQQQSTSMSILAQLL